MTQVNNILSSRIANIARPAFYAFAAAALLSPAASSHAEVIDSEMMSSTATAAINAAQSPYAGGLREVQTHYEEIARQGGWPAFKTGASIKTGMTDSRVPTVRAILHLMGDYQPSTQDEMENAQLDAELTEAVKRFQMRHGLETDGAIGSRTQAALAVPVERRLAQLQATLERVNESPAGLEEKYVLVNVPGYQLSAVENGQTVFTSRVIVGATKHSSPLFDNEINAVSFNPAWNVPASIAAREIAAKERRNPGYISRAGFAMMDSSGGRVDPAEVDWESLGGRFPYRLRQSPGAGNALGKIKFNIPNDYNVYLHSTSSPKLFAKSDRALSHGCIRVERTRELAHFVMAGMEGWDEERIDKAYDSSTSRVVQLPEPVPVYLVYWTSWVDEIGAVHFSPDIYGKDARRVAELLENRKNNVDVASVEKKQEL